MDDAPTEPTGRARRALPPLRGAAARAGRSTSGSPACSRRPRARPHLHAIGAFALEIAGVRAKTSQPLLGEMRLRWWYDALETRSDESGGTRAHPVADALLDTLERHAIAREDIVQLLEAHVFDLYDEPMETMEALETYCDRVFGAPMRWRAAAIDAQDARDQDEALRSAGRAAGLACASARPAPTSRARPAIHSRRSPGAPSRRRGLRRGASDAGRCAPLSAELRERALAHYELGAPRHPRRRTGARGACCPPRWSRSICNPWSGRGL